MNKQKRINGIRISVVLMGILFMAIGISRGEPATVLTKAVYICLECIGIG